MTHRKHPEDDLHITIAQFLDLALPDDAVWTTVEHGGYRTKTEAAKLKAKGVKPGWPDIQIVYRGRMVCFELKAPGRKLSPVQIDMHARLSLAGVLIYPGVVTCVEQVEGFLRPIIPLKATTKARAA